MISEFDLAKYVCAVSDLAVSIEDDLTNNNGVISNNTIVALNEFAKAMEKISAVVDKLESQNKKLN